MTVGDIPSGQDKELKKVFERNLLDKKRKIQTLEFSRIWAGTLIQFFRYIIVCQEAF